MGDAGGFSVVVPAYERAATVERTLASVRRAADEWDRIGTGAAFAAGPVDIVLVDDGSTDDTARLADAVAADDPRVRVVRQPNAGVAAARNLGAAAATGRWLTFLDCDDEVDPRWLVELGAALGTGVRVAFVPGRSVRPDGIEAAWRIEPLGPAFADVEGLFNPGMFAVHRSDFLAVGGYATALTFSENTELALRLVAHLEAHDAVQTSIAATRPLVTIAMPADGRSNADSPEARLRAALYLLDVHAERLARDPVLHARYWSIAGVSAARLDEPRLALDCFLHAARLQPRSARHLARIGAIVLGPARRRWWPVSA